MPRPVIAAFAMPDRGHFQRLRPLVAELVGRDARVVVFTHPAFAADVVGAGAAFVDLFEGREIDQPGDDSWPPAVRYVTFAATHAASLRDQLVALGVSLVVYDTFAVIGAIAAQLMGIARVNMCAGHAVVPERFLEVLRSHPRMRVSATCRSAIDRLADQHRVGDVTPFSYVTALSPDLNVYSEPPQFLSQADRSALEPVVFYGSLASEHAAGPTPGARRRAAERWYGSHGDGTLEIFASFGTAVWAWRTEEAVRALTVLSDWAAPRPDVRVLVSLGGKTASAEIAEALRRSNVQVATYVNQWEALAGADVFVTHHGLNSTHEAIACGVPMLSYPFIWDQPGLAARCQELNLAVPLVDTPMAPPTARQLGSAVEELTSRRPLMADALGEAHRWEQEVVAGRAAILDLILALA